MEQQTKKRFIINTVFAGLVGLIIYISGRFLFQYLFPFVIATLLAWAVQRPAAFVSSRSKLKKGACAALIAALIYISFAVALFFVFSRIGVALRGVLKELPELLDFVEDIVIRLKNALSSFSGGISDKTAHRINEMALEMISNFKSSASKWVSDTATSFAGRLPSFLLGSIVTLVAGCYIAKDFDGLSRFLQKLSGENVYCNFIKVKNIFVTSIFKIIKGYLILMLLTFLELVLGLMLLNVNYAVLVALVVSLIDLLPVFGAGTVLIPWSIAEFLADNSGRGIGILVLYISVCIIRNFSEPKIIGSQIGINPLFTLIAMFAGLKIFGFWGLILFPLTLIVVIKYYKNEIELEAGKNS